MIAVISEYKYSKNELIKLKEQKAVINYMLLPQFYQSYAEEITKINYQLIRKSDGIIFRLEEYYSGTKESIEYALYLKKPIKIITPEGQEFKLQIQEDWKKSYKLNRKTMTTKHPVLAEFDQRRSDYYEIKNAIKQEYALKKATEDITESKEEIERFVRIFAKQYNLGNADIDYNNWAEVCTAYKSLKFYYDNCIPYGMNINEIYYKGLIEPDETPYFTEEMFDYSSDELGSFEEESYGDETLLEDMIYKGGACL